MEVFKRLAFSGGRPGLIVRLGHLIVVQVLFIFAALALILFVPESNQRLSARLTDLEHDLDAASRATSNYLVTLTHTGDNGGDPYAGLGEFMRHRSKVQRAAVVRVVDSARIEVLYAFDRAGQVDSPESAEHDISDFVDLHALRRLAAAGSMLGNLPLVGSRHVVHYRILPAAGRGSPTILVLAADHGLAVSPRSALEYTILVLFLCSALVSLLTVSLLLRKFKRPLDRIISGLEETAEGKLHHLLDLEGDPELGKLARAYNTMARRLWENRRTLDSYFSRLAQSNTELRESQSFLATLIDCSPLSVVVVGPDEKIIMFNRVATEEYGYQPEEVVGRPFEMLLAENRERGEAAPDAGESGSFEVICRRQDGLLFPAYVISGSVRAEDNRELARVYVCRDITESKDFQEMMIRLDRYYTRGEMADDIAHEINNYLAVLLGNVELLPLLLKKGDRQKIDRKLEVMRTTLEKIARFADGLLDSPPDTVRLEPTSINQVVENVIAFLKPQNKFDTINVVKELATDTPVIYVDPAQIQQLLVNLIYNAAEALAEKDGERTIRVVTSTAEPESSPGVSVVIRDNGPGVAPDKESSLFKARFTTKRRGHGIGLITCRKIVDNHAGSISYARAGGAVFSFTLPVGARPGQHSEPQTESHAHARPV